MRIHLKLSSNKYPVPFDHLHFLVGAFHKWVGTNEIHNEVSLYSLSWLKGGKANSKGLSFPEGTTWFISAYDETLIKRIINGIRDSPEVCCGMIVKEIILQQTPEFQTGKLFTVNSPVLVKELIEKEQKHILFSELKSDEILTKTLKSKLSKAGLDEQGVNVYFDRSYPQAKTKLVNYRNIGNKANICPVIIEGTPEQIGFAWNVGVGNSTGIGFGALN
ncbi:MAG: hypothetical protein RLZZ306_1592 [Bacteroidota bacterium]|jgi:CRISPR-associated endoribonuclease Cas6